MRSCVCDKATSGGIFVLNECEILNFPNSRIVSKNGRIKESIRGAKSILFSSRSASIVS